MPTVNWLPKKVIGAHHVAQIHKTDGTVRRRKVLRIIRHRPSINTLPFTIHHNTSDQEVITKKKKYTLLSKISIIFVLLRAYIWRRLLWRDDRQYDASGSVRTSGETPYNGQQKGTTANAKY